MKIFNKITIEHGCYLLSFVIALGFRTLYLGHLPLSDREAEFALQALGFARGEPLIVGSQSLYIFVTSGLFSIFGDSNFIARIFPALIGCSFSLIPILFREKIGSMAAVILSFALAIDPGLVGISRQTGSPIIDIAFIALCMGSLINGKESRTGIFGGLALLGGGGVWQGLIAILLSVLWTMIAEKKNNGISIGFTNAGGCKTISWRKILIWFVGVLIFTGSFFFIFPRGLGGAVSSVVEFFSGWDKISVISIQRMFLTLLLYEIFPVILAFLAIFTHLFTKDKMDGFISRLLIMMLLMVFVYPNRNNMDLSWVVIPLWALAARYIARKISSIENESTWLMVGQGALVFSLLIFIWFNFIGLLNSEPTQVDNQERYILIGIAIILVIVVGFLIAIGWSQKQTNNGIMVGIGAVLILYTFGAAWNNAGLGRNPAVELWRASPYPAESEIMLKTIADISQWSRGGFINQIDISVIDINSPSLKWFLRDYPNTIFSQFLPGNGSPSIVITKSEQVLSLANLYTGQDFVWWKEPEWLEADFWEFSKWVAFRELPNKTSTLIVWARSDLFPGAKLSPELVTP